MRDLPDVQKDDPCMEDDKPVDGYGYEQDHNEWYPPLVIVPRSSWVGEMRQRILDCNGDRTGTHTVF